MKKNYLVFIALFSFFFLFSCSDDAKEEEQMMEEVESCSTAGSLTATINGESWEATSFQNTVFGDEFDSIFAMRIDIRGYSSNNEQLIITFNNLTATSKEDCIRLDTYYTNINSETVSVGNNSEAGIITVIREDGTTYFSTFTDTGTIKITSCNESSNTISGEFQVQIKDFISGEIKADISGSFEDICYEIL